MMSEIQPFEPTPTNNPRVQKLQDALVLLTPPHKAGNKHQAVALLLELEQELREES